MKSISVVGECNYCHFFQPEENYCGLLLKTTTYRVKNCPVTEVVIYETDRRIIEHEGEIVQLDDYKCEDCGRIFRASRKQKYCSVFCKHRLAEKEYNKKGKFGALPKEQ